MIKKLKRNKDKYFTTLLFIGIANLSMLVTMINVNTTCNFITHQPQLPKNAKKLRKF